MPARVVEGPAKRSGLTLWVALIAALVANLLDAASTWVGIAHYQAREMGAIARAVVRAWGLVPGLIVIKGSAVLLLLAIALAGTEGEPRWWRVRPTQRRLVTGALWAATAWFGYVAFKNALGAWTLHRLTGW